MWQFDRLTTSRLARCSAMRARVLRERRTRASFLFISATPVLSSLFRLQSSGFACDSRVTLPSKSRCALLAECLLLLGLFDHHPLADVANAFALVWLGWAVG